MIFVSQITVVHIYFTDDTKLFRVIKSNSDIAILQDDLNTMIDQSDKWLLRFNK